MRFMDNYYHHQATANMPHFSGHYRQRGSGFGALAAGIGRFALPLARKFILPAAKKIGRELLVQGAPELLDVVTTKKSPKQALKNTVKKLLKSRQVQEFAKDDEKPLFENELPQSTNRRGKFKLVARERSFQKLLDQSAVGPISFQKL